MDSLRAKQFKDLKPFVLVVDDEVFNLEIISELLEDAGYQVETAETGAAACALLKQNPGKYSSVLLDRMMPEMDGIEVMQYMKQQPLLCHIPVIMQTAKATKSDIEEGLKAGVLFYITKPFNEDTLLDIVDSAVAGYVHQKELSADVANKPVQARRYGEYNFRTMDEARTMATVLAHACPDPQRAVVGLAELLYNAVEHGNLRIGYSEKTELLKKGVWMDEVLARQSSVENKDKEVTVSVSEEGGAIQFVIKDEGEGFDSDRYLYIDAARATSINGRGIAIAKAVSFDCLNYADNGSKVVATIKTNKG